jgi:hypothetical protein
MTLFRQVSWLAGHNPSPPSRAFCKAQWPFGEGLAAYSCGRSFGVGLPSENGKSHRIPFFADQRDQQHLNSIIED